MVGLEVTANVTLADRLDNGDNGDFDDDASGITDFQSRPMVF